MKKTVKYFSMFLLLVALVLGVVGCKKEDNEEEPVDIEQPTSEPVKIDKNEELIIVVANGEGKVMSMIANNRFSHPERARYELYGHFAEEGHTNSTDAGLIEIVDQNKAILNSLGKHLSYNYTLTLDKEYYQDKLPYSIQIKYVLGDSESPETDLDKVKGYNGQVKIIISIIVNEAYPDVERIMPQGQISFNLATTEIISAVGALSEIRQGNALQLVYMGIPGKSIDYEIVVKSENFTFSGVQMMFQRFNQDIITRMIPSIKDLIPEETNLELKANYLQMINLALNQVKTASNQVSGTLTGLTTTGLSSYKNLVETAQTISQKSDFSGAVKDLSDTLSITKEELLGYLDTSHTKYEENKEKLSKLYDEMAFRKSLIGGANYQALTSVSRATALDKLSTDEDVVAKMFDGLGSQISEASSAIETKVITKLDEMIKKYEDNLQAPIPLEDIVENKDTIMEMTVLMVNSMNAINKDLHQSQTKLVDLRKAVDQAANALRAYDAYVNISDTLIDLNPNIIELKDLLKSLVTDNAILGAKKDEVSAMADELDPEHIGSVMSILKSSNQDYQVEQGELKRKAYKEALDNLQVQVQNAQLSLNGLDNLINNPIKFEGKEVVFMQVMFIVELVSKVFPYLPEHINLGPDVMMSFLDKDNNPAVGALQFMVMVSGL